ncbi:MAG: hypothetical protein H8E41_13405 [Desulfobulbaceae bacterium]|uniref:Uncharacterized protein n=1 Tax=Candidatus Desulfobia pelagia TaxID=2841692 RepID=A0A8J6NI15_9BACT|nr:hypothetical protein [Candidatus Desulfobia pelagia]
MKIEIKSRFSGQRNIEIGTEITKNKYKNHNKSLQWNKRGTSIKVTIFRVSGAINLNPAALLLH